MALSGEEHEYFNGFEAGKKAAVDEIDRMRQVVQYEIDVVEAAKVEIERLRAALHIARGALLGIGTDYAKGVADVLVPVLDPALGDEQEAQKP